MPTRVQGAKAHLTAAWKIINFFMDLKSEASSTRSTKSQKALRSIQARRKETGSGKSPMRF